METTVKKKRLIKKRVFEKIFSEAERNSYNTTRWYTNTDGFLEHLPSEGSLYYN